jgi:hypothetical protein
MNQQDNSEPNKQPHLVEDLTVNQDQAVEVKGGEGRTFYAYQPGFLGGVSVASGD